MGSQKSARKEKGARIADRSAIHAESSGIVILSSLSNLELPRYHVRRPPIDRKLLLGAEC